MRLQPRSIPEMARWDRADNPRPSDRIFARCALDPVEERLPHTLHLTGIEPVRKHHDLERVVVPNTRLFAPVVIEEALAIEAQELPDEPPIRVVRACADFEVRDAEEFRKLVKFDSQLAHNTKGSAATAFERPEQIGVRAGIRDPDLAVRSHHFGFQQTARGGAVVLRKTSEPAALCETCKPHR